MKIEHVVIVLGKRLQHSELTAEGRSRVDGVIEYISNHCMENTLVGFCIFLTARQTRSEAGAMLEYYLNQAKVRDLNIDHIPVLLEEKSTSTIENIRNLAYEMIQSDLIVENDTIKVTFVSNDYHLERILEIQHYLDEQGLLKTLIETCSSAGLKLNIPYQLEQHICVPYPTKNQQGELFLAIEALTTYRVYLEGVVADSFVRSLQAVRQEPLNIALETFKRVELILRDTEGANVEREFADKCAVLRTVMPLLKQSVLATDPNASKISCAFWLASLDVNLTMLNRLLDPETDINSRWWK